MILDALDSQQSHAYRQHWLLADYPYDWQPPNQHLNLHTPQGDYHIYWLNGKHKINVDLVRSDTSTPRGWRSRYYLERTPAISLSLQTLSSSERFITLFSPHPVAMNLAENELQMVTEEMNARIQLSSQDDAPLIATISTFGRHNQTLVIE